MERAEEQRLIRRARRGDRRATEALIREHQGSLYAYMLRMTGRRDVAEEVVQEAFVRALSHLDRFDDRFRFSTWVFTIAKRLHVNTVQKRAPIFSSGAAEVAAGWSEAWPGEASAEDERLGRVQRALLRLPEVQRSVLVLFTQLDWSIRRIAQHLSLPEGTVKSHLHRSRARVRKLVEEAEGVRSEEVVR